MVFLLTVVFIVIILPLSAHMFYSDVIYFSVCLRCCVFALILASIHFPLCSLSLAPLTEPVSGGTVLPFILSHCAV